MTLINAEKLPLVQIEEIYKAPNRRGNLIVSPKGFFVRQKGEKTIAKWICIECSEDEGGEVFLCEDCIKEHEDHYIDEILY